MTKLIPILSDRCLVLELPEGQQPMGLWTIEPNRLFYVDKNGCDTNISLPPGNWRIIGMLSEVTERQASNIVQSFKFKDGYLYNNYITGNRDTTDTAIESLESAIEAENWYFENPLGKEHPERKAWQSNSDALDDGLAWANIQSRVLDRSRCLLLGRIEGV